MKVLAELAFEYILLMCSPSEYVMDEDYLQQLSESLPSYFEAMSQEEKSQLSAVAQEVIDRALKNPNDYQFSKLDMECLTALSSGRAYDEW